MKKKYIGFLFISCLAVYGCATIMQGSTQDVQVIMPEGTRISDAFDSEGELMIIHHQSGNTMLRLKRKKDYSLRFFYKGQEAMTTISGSVEPQWIVADLFSFYGLIVDAITGAWNSFDDPITVHFPADTTEEEKYLLPIIETNDEASSPKTGIVLNAKGGLAFPMSQPFGFSYGVGLGYEVLPRFTVLIAYEGGTNVGILSQYSSYYANGSYSHFNLEFRYKMQGNFYITGGGGWSQITSDSLTLDRYTYNDTTGMSNQNQLRTAPANKWIPTLFAGIGYSGTVSYIELRHTFGLSTIPLSNGETGKFGTTTLTFGVNFHF